MEEKLKTLVETQKPFLYILTPCYGNMCHVNYTSSLLSTTNLLNQYNIRYEITFCRNEYTTQVTPCANRPTILACSQSERFEGQGV